MVIEEAPDIVIKIVIQLCEIPVCLVCTAVIFNECFAHKEGRIKVWVKTKVR